MYSASEHLNTLSNYLKYERRNRQYTVTVGKLNTLFSAMDRSFRKKNQRRPSEPNRPL